MMRRQNVKRQHGSCEVGLLLVAFLAVIFTSCATPPKESGRLVWPLPPEEPKIEYVRAFCCLNDFKKNAFLETVIGSSNAGRKMSKPYGVATGKDGKVYVTDTGLRIVWVFDEKAKKVSFLGSGLRTPTGVAVDNTGKVFVADSLSQHVFAFDSEGKMVMAIGKPGDLGNPSGLAIDLDTNRLYVANARLHMIKVYDANNGKFLFDIGERGSKAGQFNFPTNLSVRHGKLYVSDSGNFRVQVLDLNGKPLKTFGKVGDALGEFARPKGIGVDSEGHIYAVDAGFDNFQIFNDDGQLLLFVGAKGTDPGYFWLPAGLYVDENDRIYVADQYNQRVQVFQFIGGKHKGRLAESR